jgi:hypothetical protein
MVWGFETPLPSGTPLQARGEPAVTWTTLRRLPVFGRGPSVIVPFNLLSIRLCYIQTRMGEGMMTGDPRRSLRRGCAGPAPRRRARCLAVTAVAWETRALSARGFRRVGRHSEYAIQTVRRCARRGPGGQERGPGGSREPPGPPYLLLPGRRREVRRAAGDDGRERERGPEPEAPLRPGGAAFSAITRTFYSDTQ